MDENKIVSESTATQIENKENEKTKEFHEESPITSGSATGSWWGGWINSAKEKSASVLQAVKQDLDEISNAVSDTFQMPPDSEENTVNYMKQSLSSFFGSVTEALNPSLDDDDVAEAVLITSDDTIVLTGFHKHLAEMQGKDKTYLEEPCAELADKYKLWLEIVEQDQFTQQRIAKMLASSTILNDKYNEHVPDTVSHMNFWKRYLFKKALLEDELANAERKAPEKVVVEEEVKEVITPPQVQIQTVQPKKKEPAAEEVNWESDFERPDFELSEEEQARLLAEYEQEIKEREKTKQEILEETKEFLGKGKSVSKSSKTPSVAGAQKVSAATKSKTVPEKVQSQAVKTNATAKAKNTKNNKQQQQQQKVKPTTTTNESKPEAKKDDESPKDELTIEKNHFNKEETSSSNSDDWEKDFDM
ncbi:unnamed protein product [Diamesa serratosioi]